jgi:hypothetical protein
MEDFNVESAIKSHINESLILINGLDSMSIFYKNSIWSMNLSSYVEKFYENEIDSKTTPQLVDIINLIEVENKNIV